MLLRPEICDHDATLGTSVGRCGYDRVALFISYLFFLTLRRLKRKMNARKCGRIVHTLTPRTGVTMPGLPLSSMTSKPSPLPPPDIPQHPVYLRKILLQAPC